MCVCKGVHACMCENMCEHVCVCVCACVRACEDQLGSVLVASWVCGLEQQSALTKVCGLEYVLARPSVCVKAQRTGGWLGGSSVLGSVPALAALLGSRLGLETAA